MTADAAGGGPAAAQGPLSFTAMAREAWRLYRLRPLAVTALFALLYIAVALLALIALRSDALSRGAEIAVGLTFQFGVPVAGSLLTAVAVVVMHDAAVGESGGLGAALRAVRPQWAELLGAALLAAILALVLYIPPLSLISVYIGTSGSSAVLFGPPIVVHAVVLERRTLAQAWARTRALMSGNWGRILLYWLTGALIVTVIGGLLTVPAQVIGSAALLIVNGIVLGVLIPYVVAFVYASYLDVRSQTDAPRADDA